ncbi:nitroreductase family deazaflavin-dependent oxidoreductase [Saccharopolyspora sp. NFXS83]|uniref:nitroreductase family deazaflavin-dependent oxidoreductase n=1 Tax=Saccharopolyspora sp. NFXS83 TaxID=2993560 RepID=UPI00224AD398|nr:nitroreductase family deazaflavin-dependent oxidoreductase [Saccharopolyspora sp. NFXS83]MCX2729566.1 nitroreductase family deazaflavin-dependent oxidoreductase [Saccharopolyspora sp. NFXS83]
MSGPARATAIGRWGAALLRNRALMRAPILLYRARLGFLLGSRLLMLEHLGRNSGVVRHVVLEVIGHPAPDVYVIASGFGERAQWYRNLMANPRVRISVAGHNTAPATARRLPTAEADSALADYARRHPRAWAKFKNVLENTLGITISEQDTALPVLELRLDPRTPVPS